MESMGLAKCSRWVWRRMNAIQCVEISSHFFMKSFLYKSHVESSLWSHVTVWFWSQLQFLLHFRNFSSRTEKEGDSLSISSYLFTFSLWKIDIYLDTQYNHPFQLKHDTRQRLIVLFVVLRIHSDDNKNHTCGFVFAVNWVSMGLVWISRLWQHVHTANRLQLIAFHQF